MTDKFENVYPTNRQQHIAQAKQDIVTNPEVKQWKNDIASALKILAQQGGVRAYEIGFVSNHTLRLIPMYYNEEKELFITEEEKWMDFLSKDSENFFIPSMEELIILSDTCTLKIYESDKQRDVRIAE